jgi:protein gp37
MAKSTIEWTDGTWNPTTGCTKISKECDNCYAEVMTRRLKAMGQEKYANGFDVVKEHSESLLEPYGWKKPQTVFVNSMSDLFHKDISLEFIQRVFKVMNDTPQHTYQILTKRHHELLNYSNKLNWTDNIWMGVSVGSMASVRKIDNLRKCGAKHKFLSVEPLIEELTDLNLDGVELVFVGGESGVGDIRPMKHEWVKRVKEACEKYNTTFFFKQWGTEKFNPDQNDPTIHSLHRYHAKGGAMLDGKLYLDNPSMGKLQIPAINLFGNEYLVMDEIDDLKTIWELKSYLPFNTATLFENLKKDIKANGINDPILYYLTPKGEKLVIEGHTRLSAAIELRLKDVPQKQVKEKFSGLDDIKLWMIKHQFTRRNLPDAKRLELAFLCRPSIEAIALKNKSDAGKGIEVDKHTHTYEEIARLADVGRTTAIKYAKILSSASDAIINQVNDGKVSISSAYGLVKDSPDKIRKEKAQKKEPSEPAMIIVESVEEGKKMIQENQIDFLVVDSGKTNLTKFKDWKNARIGIFRFSSNPK